MSRPSPAQGIGSATRRPLAQRRDELVELAPLLRRAVNLDPRAATRLRATAGTVSGLVRLPFSVLVGRSVAASPNDALDDQCTVAVAALLDWLDRRSRLFPAADESAWRGGVPPVTRWQHLDAVPSTVVRDLVTRASQALDEASAHEGGPGARPRAALTEALLDSVALTVVADSSLGAAPNRIALTLRPLSAMVRMGLVPPTGHLRVDISGRWVRLASPLGSAYIERPGLGLTVLS